MATSQENKIKEFNYDQQTNQLESVSGADYQYRTYNLTSFQYTRSGNLKSKTLNCEIWSYHYNFENRLINVERSGTPDEDLAVGYDWSRISFQYNDAGQRTRKQYIREDNSRVDTFYVSNTYELRQTPVRTKI